MSPVPESRLFPGNISKQRRYFRRISAGGLVSDDENNRTATKDVFEVRHFSVAKRQLMPRRQFGNAIFGIEGRIIAGCRTASAQAEFKGRI